MGSRLPIFVAYARASETVIPTMGRLSFPGSTLHPIVLQKSALETSVSSMKNALSLAGFFSKPARNVPAGM